jgi:subtilisin family serine protease
MMRRRLFACCVALGPSVLGGCSASESASQVGDALEPTSDVTATGAAKQAELVSRYVVFEAPSALDLVRGAGPLDASARAEVQKRATELRAEHAALRPALEAKGAHVVADLVLVANALQVQVPPGALRSLERLPGVSHLETPTTLRSTLAPTMPRLGVTGVWQGPPGLRGEGMRIGIIDDGVDYGHAAFDGSGDPADYDANDRTIIEPNSFPTAKVIGGKDLAGDDYDALGFVGSTTPSPDADPMACAVHGTHVASGAAGVGVTSAGLAYAGTYDASLDPTGFAIYPGAAPAATLFAIKIFGCGSPELGGSSELFLAAFELAVDPDEDLDVADRLDIVNLSAGSTYALGTALERAAVSNLTAAGSLLVAAQGNDPDASFTASFPASEPEALAVGGSLRDEETQTYPALDVTAPSGVAGIYPLGVPGQPPGVAELGAYSGQAVLAEPDLACEPLTNAAAVAGKLVLARRGVCLFGVKAQQAADAGAVGILIVNNAFGDFPNGVTGGYAVPTFGLRQTEGEALAAASPVEVSITPGATATVAVGPDYAAFFSSRGPTADRLLLKPDVVAPVDYVGALRGSGAGTVELKGTSMSTPITAGAAALLRQADPSLGPLEVKELMTSTARPVAGPLVPFPATFVGAGRVQIDDAVGAAVSARVDGVSGEVGVSFGAVIASSPVEESRTVVVTNRGAAAVDLDVGLEAGHRVSRCDHRGEPDDGVGASGRYRDVRADPGGRSRGAAGRAGLCALPATGVDRARRRSDADPLRRGLGARPPRACGEPGGRGAVRWHRAGSLRACRRRGDRVRPRRRRRDPEPLGPRGAARQRHERPRARDDDLELLRPRRPQRRARHPGGRRALQSYGRQDLLRPRHGGRLGDAER